MYRRLFTTLLAIFVLSGCGVKYKLDRDQITPEAPWPVYHRGPSNTGAVADGEFDGHLKMLWKTRNSGKPAGPLALANHAVVFPDTKKKLRFYDLLSGKEQGRIKLKGSPRSGLAIQDSLGFYALTRRGSYVGGFDLIRYKSLWKRRIKDANPGPIIVYNRLIVSSGDGLVQAYRLDDGELLWQHELEGRLETSASFAEGRIWQANDQGALVALAVDDGSELVRAQLPGPVVSPLAVTDRVYAVTMTGHVCALDPADGTMLWQVDLGAPTWTTPAVADGRLFLGMSSGRVVALDAADGHELWHRDTESVVRASAVVIGSVVAAGTLSGKLLTLAADDGTTIDSVQIDGAIQFSPVTDGRRLYVATQSGRIICFGEDHDQADLADHRISPQP